MCITPSGMPYETLHPSDIVVVSVDNQIIEKRERRPSIEMPLHTAMYRRRPDVFGVVHTHSTYCTAWACVDGGMPCITSEAAGLVGGNIRCAAFVPPGSDELAEVTSEAIGDDKAVLMGNHGRSVLTRQSTRHITTRLYWKRARRWHFCLIRWEMSIHWTIDV